MNEPQQIEFRFWDPYRKEMIYNGYEHADLSFNGLLVCEGDTTPLQYTGLNDKNGKKIFDGDIVRISNLQIEWKHEEPDFDWRVLEVKRNRYTWAYNNSHVYQPLSDYDNRTAEPYDIELIGNVYENPELVKL